MDVITKDRILKGLDSGVITIEDGHNYLGDGVVAAIEDNWFYFDADTVRNDTTPDDYLKSVPVNEIAGRIHDALIGIRDDISKDEYDYYDLVLSANGL